MLNVRTAKDIDAASIKRWLKAASSCQFPSQNPPVIPIVRC